MALPAQGRFRTKEPDLKTDLEREHRAIVAEVKDIRASYQQLGRRPVLITSSPWRAGAGDCLVMAQASTVTLPNLGPSAVGAKITFLRKGASGALTIASDTGALVNGGTSDSFTTEHRIVAEFDGTDWYAA